jgi:Ca2+-binding EF-hand superfamily protein
MPRFTALWASAILAGAIAAAGTASAQDRPEHGHGGREGPGPWAGAGLDFAAIDSDGNGSLSRDELTVFAVARISTVDTDGNGTLERAEIVAIFPDAGSGFFRPFAQPRGERFADRLLERMDATEAGAVAAAAVAERHVNAILARLDSDHDGAIAQAEAEDAPRRGPREGRGGRGRHGH